MGKSEKSTLQIFQVCPINVEILSIYTQYKGILMKKTLQNLLLL